MKFLILTLFFLFILGPPQAQATLLTLSDESSNSSDYTTPEWLNANLDFVVVGTTLTLTVTNNTFDDYPSTDQTAFNISRLFFNINEDTVTDLGLNQVWEYDETGKKLNGDHLSDWDDYTSVAVDNFHAGGFGKFDVQVMGDDTSVVIYPGYTAEFVFGISGTGSFSDDDFTTYISAPLGDVLKILGLAAGKFVSGGPTGDDSAFGVVVPEPTTIALFGLWCFELISPTPQMEKLLGLIRL